MQLKNVSKTYIMGEVSVTALQEACLDIYAGEVLCILGPSGSGKSTMLNIMGGMDLPTAGQVLFREKDLSKASDAQLTSYRRKQVGFVFQFYNLIPDLTAFENVELAAGLVSSPRQVYQILKEVGLAERAGHFPAQLSGGEQQRVSIARAAVKNPPLLLCDEPTGALDSQTGKVILALLREFSRQHQTTVVIVTHNSPIAAMADRVVRMRSGCVIEVSENSEPTPPERIDW